MAASPVFGRIENPGSLNLEPFTFTIAGVRRNENGGQEEVTFEFTVKGVRPFYVQLDMVRGAAAGSGSMAATAIIDFIELALIDDAERDRWRETLELPDVQFNTEMLGEISDWLGEQYSARPTRPPSASRSSASRGGRKSSPRAGARGGATSAASRRGKR